MDASAFLIGDAYPKFRSRVFVPKQPSSDWRSGMWACFNHSALQDLKGFQS
jgi:hypothetical protein